MGEGPTLRQLEYFLSAVEHGSFSAAAEHAHQLRGVVIQQPLQVPGQVLDLLGQCLPAPGQQPQAVRRRLCGGDRRVGREAASAAISLVFDMPR